MTTTDTRNVEATVDQVKRCADAGADIVRLTVQGKKEAEACFKIRERLFQVHPEVTSCWVSWTFLNMYHAFLCGKDRCR
jgi:4-hydroxy-3-methylbut-2-en-1-yl diphosphate synthase IspG/GcpE